MKTSAGQAFAALVLGVVLCAGMVFLGPVLVEMLVPMLGEGQAENHALIETLFVVIVFGGMAITAILAARAMGVNALRPGDRGWAGLVAGAVLGIAGLLVAASYAALSGALVTGAGAGAGAAMLVWGVAVVGMQAGAEEVFFRGWMQPVVQRAWGGAVAVLLVSAAFAALHVMGGVRAPVSLLNLFLGGAMFGLLALRQGGIAAALGAHVAWNAAEQLLLGLEPNPGAGSFGALFDYDLTGRPLWGGSAEGLNASIGMTFALLAIVVPLAMERWRAAREPAPIPAAATG